MGNRLLVSVLSAMAAVWAMETDGSFWYMVLREMPVYWLVFAAVYIALSPRQSQSETEE